MKKLNVILAGLVFAGLLGCGEDPKPEGVKLTRQELGEKWPFTVDEVTLICEGDQTVRLIANGEKYNLNKEHRDGLPSAQDAIVAREADGTFKQPEALSGILDRGLKLCGE